MGILQTYFRSYRMLVPKIPSKKELEAVDRQIEREIVSELQEGSYLSEPVLDSWAAEVAAHKF